MAPPHHRRLKQIELELGATRFECQIREWELDPGEQDGDRRYTFCAVDPEFTEETDAEPTLKISYFADWRSGGLSDYLWANRGKLAHCRIRSHPELIGESVQFEGDVRLKAPTTGGEARTTEVQEVTLLVTNLTYVRV